KGDKVAILFHNRPEFLESNIALQAIGAIPVPVNYRYVKSELEFLLNNCDARGLIFEGELLDLVLETKPLAPKVEFYVSTLAEKPITRSFFHYEELIRGGKNKKTKVKIDWEDTAVIIYTGGTTGRPKGVMLTYQNMMSNQEGVISLLVNFLPPVKDVNYEKFARNKGEEKLLNVLNFFLGQMYSKLFTDPTDRKIIVYYLPTKEEKGVVPIPPLTLRQVEGKLKMFHGMPEKYDVLFHAKLMDQMRDLVNLLPKSYSKRGKLSIMPKLIWKFLFGGIKIKGKRKDRMQIIKSMSAKPEVDKITTMLITPPLFHLASYALFIMNWIVSGGTVVLPESTSFNPKEIIELMEQEQVNWTFFVPTMWKRIVKYIVKEKPDTKIESLEVAFSGAALLRAKIKKQILKYFPNALLIDVFGQTEMAPAASVKIDGDESTVRDRSVGKVVSNVEIKIIDDSGVEVEEGVIGEICYRSTAVMKGYYGDEEKTAETIDKEGWLHSGDLGYVKDGELYTIERKKECINTGGEKVFPLEVEEVISEHPCVEDVCVIGVPDEDWGSTVRAVIITKEGKNCTAEEIMDFCKGKMAGYKKPRTIVFTKEFPISPVGKILRQKIRELYGQPDTPIN
ncbi:MAG: AMP-binding protein, partial [Promethearchaeota archaeon]